MKVHSLIFLLLTTIGTQAFAQVTPATRAEFVSRAKQQALGIIAKASRHRENKQSDLENYQMIRAALLSTPIQFPNPNEEYRLCSRNEWWAFYHRQTRSIYLCSMLLEHYEKIVPQVLIHEAVHAAGQGDDCETTLLEFDVMLTAGLRPTPNGYVKSCGISWSY